MVTRPAELTILMINGPLIIRSAKSDADFAFHPNVKDTKMVSNPLSRVAKAAQISFAMLPIALVATTSITPADATIRVMPSPAFVKPVTSGADQPAVTRVQFLEDVGGSERINFSGKLRMLSQRISAAACNVHAGVALDDNLGRLSSASAEFEKIVEGLEFGDEELGIKGAEERRKTLVRISALKEGWVPFFAAVETLSADPKNADAMAYISQSNIPLLELAKLLVSELSGQYSNPAEMLQSDAMAIDISGRQRMLTQKVSKEACAIASNNPDLGNLDALRGTMSTFEISLTALREGLPAAGLNPPKTPEISQMLDVVVEHWTTAKVEIESLLEGAYDDGELRAQIVKDLDTTMADMNRTVGLYAEAAKLGL